MLTGVHLERICERKSIEQLSNSDELNFYDVFSRFLFVFNNCEVHEMFAAPKVVSCCRERALRHIIHGTCT